MSFAEIVDNLAKHVLVVADLTLQTAVEKACAAELTEKGNHCITWRKCGRSNSYVSRVLPLWPEKSIIRRKLVSFAIRSVMVVKRWVTL